MSENISYHPNYQPEQGSSKDKPREKAQTIAITSGKGGVGKTNITTNLAIALATRHARVCIFDADTNLANINILLGISPRYTLEHLLNGERTLDEIICEGPRGVHLIPAASGIAQYTSLTREQQEILTNAMQQLEDRYDFLVIDTGAGVGDTVLSFIQSAQQCILVVSPEPTSLTDAFSLLKVLKKHDIDKPTHILVNMAMNAENGREVYERFQNAVTKYLQKPLRYLGYIPLDENIITSVSLQQPVIIQKPTASSSRCFFDLATTVCEKIHPEEGVKSFSEQWEESAHQKEFISTPATTPVPEPASIPMTKEPAELLRQCLASLRNKSVEPAEIAEPIHQLLDLYLTQYRAFPGDTKKTLYRALETGLIDEDEIRDLIATLETVYEKRRNKPVHNADDIMVKLLAQTQGSRETMQSLYRLIEDSYIRQFGEPLQDPKTELLRRLRSGQSSEEDFTKCIADIRSAYQDRFNRTLLDERDIALENIHDITESILHNEGELKTSLDRMTEWLDDTIKAREELKRQLHPLLRRDSAQDNSDED